MSPGWKMPREHYCIRFFMKLKFRWQAQRICANLNDVVQIIYQYFLLFYHLIPRDGKLRESPRISSNLDAIRD